MTEIEKLYEELMKLVKDEYGTDVSLEDSTEKNNAKMYYGYIKRNI